MVMSGKIHIYYTCAMYITGTVQILVFGLTIRIFGVKCPPDSYEYPVHPVPF
jgi:hypothetical protein